MLLFKLECFRPLNFYDTLFGTVIIATSMLMTVAGVTFPLQLTGPAVVVAPAPPLFS